MPYISTVLIKYAENYFNIISILNLKQPNIELKGFSLSLS